MARPAGVSRVVLSGHLAGGEIFQTGFYIAGAPVDQATTQGIADGFASNWVASAGDAARSILAGSSGYDKVTVYSYVAAGPAPASFVGEAALVGVGTGGGQLPNQIALVATLLTGAAGRRNRGRMYLPANGMPLTGHQALLSLATSVATGMVAIFSQFDDAGVVVVSGVAGTARRVTSVRVDTRPDVQRRRAGKQTIIGKAELPVA